MVLILDAKYFTSDRYTIRLPVISLLLSRSCVCGMLWGGGGGGMSWTAGSTWILEDTRIRSVKKTTRSAGQPYTILFQDIINFAM